jgi:hypothetical protein
VEFEEEG